jgi:DNA-binding transcriptional LysR family regulator
LSRRTGAGRERLFARVSFFIRHARFAFSSFACFLPRMDTTFLNTFVLTVEAGSMAEVARRLGLTPGAIAQQIRSLERTLGVQLIARAGRTVQATEAGHSVIAQARSILRDLEDMKAVASQGAAGGEVVGELRLGCINTALHTLMPDILVRIVERHPKLSIFMQSALSNELLNAVEARELDAAVCLHPQFALPKIYHWLALREEKLVALVPRRLARRDPHELLRTMPFIRYDRNQWGGRQADDYLKKAGIVPQERFELGALMAIATMVDRGLGVSIVPDTGLEEATRLQVSKLELPLRTAPRRVGIFWLRSAIRQKAIDALVEQARLVVK